ncbi:MAG: ankyrin repeat domain-containing protein [Halobacteriaceae archaeon]
MRTFLESSGTDTIVSATLRGDALVEACAYGWKDVARMLLDGGADVNALDGEALVFASSRWGTAELVRLLLERGACVHAQHNAALHRAREVGDSDVMHLLLPDPRRRV